MDTEKTDNLINEIAHFIEPGAIQKIITKLTDYADILTEGKLSGIVNYNYNLNSTQSGLIIDLLIESSAISKIYNMAMKGSKDLEAEYISNIYSNPQNPENTAAHQNLKNILENRLTHQIQQYNINMNKNSTTMAMPINELRGHAKTYAELKKNKITVSTKAHHGIIAASLHDAYVTLLNQDNWFNDKTYTKYFFNEDDMSRRNILILSRRPKKTIEEINDYASKIIELFTEVKAKKIEDDARTNKSGRIDDTKKSRDSNEKARQFNDKLLMTPFGKQYGHKIDNLIFEIFNPLKQNDFNDITDESIQQDITPLFRAFTTSTSSLSDPTFSDTIIRVIDFMLAQEYGLKTFAEKFLHSDRRKPFSKFYTGTAKDTIEKFLNEMFLIYFNNKFQSLFRIIQSLDMKKFACAYIIKRIYSTEGESLTNFGYYLLRVIAKSGGIKA